MTYAELISELKKLELEEIRTNSNTLFEFVIRTELLQKLEEILKRYFGIPVKPAGEAPSAGEDKSVSAYGGIRKDQTLYSLEREGASYYAMLWPWANGILLTVKVVQSPQKNDL